MASSFPIRHPEPSRWRRREKGGGDHRRQLGLYPVEYDAGPGPAASPESLKVPTDIEPRLRRRQSSIDLSEGAMTSREYQDEARSNGLGFYAVPARTSAG